MIAFLDACIIIYWVEMANVQYSKFVKALHNLKNRYELLSFAASELSILECQVKPVCEKNAEVLEHYKKFFVAKDLDLVPISLNIIEQATLLRAYYNLATPDALQAASALSINDDVIFLTSDIGFKRVPHLKTIII